MGVLEVPLHALRAELALVEREFVPRLEPDDLVTADLQDDPALLTAEAAVRLHLSIDFDARVPTARRRLVEVRAVPSDERLVGERWACHQPKPPTRRDC